MDLSDATKILLDRIQKLEPELGTKIMGCILIQDHGEREMIRLAYAPEKLLEKLVHKTKLQLGFLAKTPVSTSPSSPPISVTSSPLSEPPLNYLSFSSHSFRIPPTTPLWNPEFLLFGDSFVEFDDHSDFMMSVRRNRYLSNHAEIPVKTCHYFNRGFCKHGSACRYLHGQDNVSTVFSSHELGADDHLFSPRSLEKLEGEISELVKSTRGPVSIASLPMLYCEKYGRMLQAEGYLTESQRHGRAGYSLTKLLARLKTVQLIDRPHGQHSVILTEDVSKHIVEHRGERSDLASVASGSSRQIYLTFPSESTFTEEDVSDYFGEFGNVEDVRIPCQQKRMFGFVTFSSATTVKTILAKGNPHFVHGSRVLVKPYREKSKLVDRKYMDKNDILPRCEAPRILRRQLMEAQEQALEMERRRLSELQFRNKNIHNRQFNGFAMEDFISLEGASEFTRMEQYHYLLDAINNSSVTDESSSQHFGIDYFEQQSRGISLPESPFTPGIGGSIPAVI